MELKDGKIFITDEEKALLNSEVGKKWLEENKFTIEKKVEIEKPLTDDIVNAYLSKNQSISDKLYNDNALKFLKSKLGKDLVADDLAKEITFKNDFDKFKNEAIKTAVGLAINSISKHGDLLLNAVDFSKIDIKDNKIVGFDDEVNKLKTTYPDLFAGTKQNSNTPAKLPENSGAKITKEQFNKMNYSERAKLYNEDKATYDELTK